MSTSPLLLIHGGAGGDGPWRGMSDLDPARIDCMQRVLDEVGDALESGSIDAFEAAVRAVEILEDEPLFNAGRGSVLDAHGNVTMDASVMRGCDGAAGSVINVRRIRHPIRAATMVLQRGWPVMLNGEAADLFAIESGAEEVDPVWLITDLRRAQWRKWRDSLGRPGSTDEDDCALLDHDISDRVRTEFSDEVGGAVPPLGDAPTLEQGTAPFEQDGRGTVGAVARDRNGRLASATSTGGMTGKPDGRVGDTPIIGAGTWADPNIAVSSTGIGEAYIRRCAAHRLAMLVELGGYDLAASAEQVLDEVAPLGGRGGLIAITREGESVLPFQTTLMYRGSRIDGISRTAIGPDSGL